MIGFTQERNNMVLISLLCIPINLFCVVYLLWVAFAKVNRPITWAKFNGCLFGAAVSLIAFSFNTAAVILAVSR